MVAARWFKVGIGPSWELVDALVRPCSLWKVLPLPPWLSVSRTATPDLTWPGPITKMPTRAITWVLDDAYRPPSPVVPQFSHIYSYNIHPGSNKNSPLVAKLRCSPAHYKPETTNLGRFCLGCTKRAPTLTGIG